MYGSYVQEEIVKILAFFLTIRIPFFIFGFCLDLAKYYKKIARREVNAWRPKVGSGLH